jgi:hypothetical protein
MPDIRKSLRDLRDGVKQKWESMTHVEFAGWSAGLNSLIVAVGVLVAGYWTFHLHRVLNAEEGAAYQLLHSRAELTKLELDLVQAREERARAFGQVSLIAAPLTGTTAENCYLQVNATVANAGRRPIKLWFIGDSIPPPLNVASVTVTENGETRFRRVAYFDVYSFSTDATAVYELPEASLQPGEQSSYPFLLKLNRDSTYLIQFSIPVDTAHREKQPDSLWYWAARTYVAGCSIPPASAAESSRTPTESGRSTVENATEEPAISDPRQVPQM